MRSPRIIEHTGDGGYFRVFVTAPGGRRTEITGFRGVPVKVASLSSTDPFGDATGSIILPQVTGFDRPGSGDLRWMVDGAQVDIQYHYADGSLADWRWEGTYVAEDISESSTMTLKGALYQLDNFKAAPWYPQYPVPYELLLKRTFDPKTHPTLKTGALVVQFPDDWNVKVPTFDDPDYLWFLRPYGVKPKENWTGLTSRSTGGWDNALTGFVQSLLSVMYTEEGQWTISKRKGRIPVLHVREHTSAITPATPTISYGAPGVGVNLSRDYSQSANVIYGAGQDLNGTSFSGQRIGARSAHTFYDPFAALPQVHPVDPSNPRYDARVPRRETRLQFPAGVDELAARSIAETHLRRFADPGYTGTITLTSDPLVNGQPYPRILIKAGENIVISGFRGTDILMHITEVTCTPFDEGMVTLTVDSKFRDALTVHEVRARTRDALDPIRLLRVGQFSTTVQDLILPWSYSQGSGCIPSGGPNDSTEFFTKRLGETSRFPWTEFTTKYPPKKYPKYYVKINPHNANADKNWGNLRTDGIAQGFPIRMSQNGTIRLIQVALYDENGNVVPARFHFSIYNNSGVTSRDMPRIPDNKSPGREQYKPGQAYPFFQGAFERLNPDGTETTDPNRILHDSAGLVVGWGNYYEEAGYSPGKFSAGNPKTGLLIDESPWSFDTTMDPDFDKYDVKNTREATTTGLLYGMVYVDHHGNKPVYLMGRAWRSEPGA